MGDFALGARSFVVLFRFLGGGGGEQTGINLLWCGFQCDMP